ncbi:glycoside hydrolase family 88 protein [Metabacillus bambusae]|uniref:Glycoside hydrolase family 88 protein n=1 Tax=Metabacillus bambusae TaxID=2795218 RepID=A0ABS3N294_9BACI|nr:glycoside hydrolase family 88 protein [Metabacillus bambusae]MBO1512367.1 glycoside hydrolase family 88 protein [Metabacillus bambusae]
MILNILSTLIFLIICIVITLDLLPKVKDWFLRLHIGRINDKVTWNENITKKGLKWILETPKIKVTDNTRLVVIDMLKGNYSNNTIQHWQEAALILGISEYLKDKTDKEIEKAITNYLNKKFHKNGKWKVIPKHIDGAILAYAIMKLDFINTDQYKSAFDEIWDLIINHIGEDGTVEYRKFMKSYRYVDTIGFICPFLVSYGLKFKKEECIQLAIKQIKEFETFGMLNKYFIPCHVYKIDNKIPLGLFGWGRGLGWYAIGLIDSWNELREDCKYKKELEISVKRFAIAAMDFQQENGSWNWSVTRNESRSDSSSTATLGWFMLNAAKIQDISEACLSSSKSAIDYLMKVTRRNGAVDFSQGDTKDIGVYSALFDILPFTQGFSIRCINYYIRNFKLSNNTKYENDEDKDIMKKSV